MEQKYDFLQVKSSYIKKNLISFRLCILRPNVLKNSYVLRSILPMHIYSSEKKEKNMPGT